MAVSYGCWQCLGLPLQCLLLSLPLAWQRFPLISCQHCWGGLCSTSYPPSGLGGLQGGTPHSGNTVHQ